MNRSSAKQTINEYAKKSERETRWGLVLLAIALALMSAVGATAQTYSNLYAYPGTNNNTSGIIWPSILSQGQDGDLYSTIETNGPPNAGSVYKITTSGSYSLLYSFCAEGGHCLTTGAYPFGGVTLGLDGNLWGTTQGGGKDGAGTVFKMTPAGTLTTLYSFTNGNDDSAPIFTLLQGQDGNMYGVSEEQYNGQYGSFFKMSTKGKVTPHPFAYTNGASPSLPVQGTDGNFYGTTQVGGDKTCRCGVVYKATAAGKITVLHYFTGYQSSTQYDGSRPIGILVQGSDGNFYGTTYQGGALNVGTVFKVSPSGSYTLLYSFGSVAGDGTLPIAGLTAGTDGNFYGVTGNGGTKNTGIIFKITPKGSETLLYNFCSVSCYDGIYPTTPLLQHTNGKFYGNTSGNSLGGAVFYSFDMGLKPFVQMVLSAGPVGSTVEILGQGFTGASSVKFNGTSATFKVISDTYLTAKVPAGATAGGVSVATSSGTLASNRVFLVVPTITSFTPTSGPVGTQVVVSGSGFTGVTSVKFGSKAAAFTVNNDSTITATVPTGAKTGKISATSAGGKATSKTAFTVTP